jgi:hypothetical protein
VALPDELTPAARRALAIGFARELVARYGVAADVAIHAPSREGDERNHHAHIMLSACTVGSDGALGKKAAELDPIFCQKHRLPNMADRERFRWAELTNLALERAGHTLRVDHRSLEAQGIDRVPSSHMGPAVAGMARRGVSSAVSLRMAAEVHDRLERAREAGELERQAVQIDRAIIDTSGDLAAATRDRDISPRLQGSARAGIDAFRAQVDQRREAESRKRQTLQAFFDFKADQERKVQVQRCENEARVKELGRQRDAAKETPGPERQKPRGPSMDR